MYPIILTNSIAIMTSFHLGFLLDKTAYSRIMHWGGCNRVTFQIYNAMGHIAPVFLSWYQVHKMHDDITPKRLWLAGGISCCAHICWALLTCGSMDLSRVYIPMRKRHWRYMWCAAVVGHYVPFLFKVVMNRLRC